MKEFQVIVNVDCTVPEFFQIIFCKEFKEFYHLRSGHHSVDVTEWQTLPNDKHERVILFSTPVEAPSLVKPLVGESLSCRETQWYNVLNDGTLKVTTKTEFLSISNCHSDCDITVTAQDGGVRCVVTVQVIYGGSMLWAGALESFAASSGRKAFEFWGDLVRERVTETITQQRRAAPARTRTLTFADIAADEQRAPTDPSIARPAPAPATGATAKPKPAAPATTGNGVANNNNNNRPPSPEDSDGESVDVPVNAVDEETRTIVTNYDSDRGFASPTEDVGRRALSPGSVSVRSGNERFFDTVEAVPGRSGITSGGSSLTGGEGVRRPEPLVGDVGITSSTTVLGAMRQELRELHMLADVTNAKLQALETALRVQRQGEASGSALGNADIAALTAVLERMAKVEEENQQLLRQHEEMWNTKLGAIITQHENQQQGMSKGRILLFVTLGLAGLFTVGVVPWLIFGTRGRTRERLLSLLPGFTSTTT